MLYYVQFNQTYIAGAVNEVVCVWKLKDGKAVTERFPDHVTTLQWKPKQKDGIQVSFCALNYLIVPHCNYRGVSFVAGWFARRMC